MNGPRAWTRVTCLIVVLALVLVSAPQLLTTNVSAAPIVSNSTNLGFYETVEGGVYSDAHMNQRLGISEADVDGIAQLNVAASISGIDYDYGLPGTSEDDRKIAKVQVIASANTRESIQYLPDNQPYYDAVLQPLGTEIDFGYEDGVWRQVPDFWYYGAWYDMLYISTQGFVILGRSIDPDLTDKTPVNQLPQDLSSPDCPKPLIAPFWRELAYPDSLSGVYISFSSKSFGSSHYVMTITWDNVRDWLPSHQTYWRSTFALNIWYSPWDVPFIEFEYESLSPVPFDTTIGLVDQSGKHVVSLPYDWETLDGKEIRFWNYYNDNFWTVLGMRVGARKFINGQPTSNDAYSQIGIRGIGELEPGGVNAHTDWVPGEYMDPNIDGAAIALGVASLAVGIAGTVASGGALTLGTGILAATGIAVDGASLLYEMGQIDPNEAVLNEAGPLDPEAYIYSHAYDPCNPTMFPDCASDVSLFPVFEYKIPMENGLDRGLQIVVQIDMWNPVTFESRNAEIVTSPLTFSLTGSDWLETNIDYRVHGLNWLGRTIPDQRTHTFKPVQDSWGYAPTSHFICSVDSKTHPSNEYGYDIMGWSKLTDDFGNDYKVRPDGTIRVDGYFRLSDTFPIGDARRNVNVYGVYSDEGSFDDIAAETSITSLANQGNYVWKYCSATLSDLRQYIPGESYRQPVKIGIGREVYGPTDYQQVAQWSSDLSIYDGNNMVLGVEVTTPGGHTMSPTCYYGQTAKQIVQYSDSHAVVGVSDTGYMLDHWVFEGVTVSPGATKTIGGTTVTASGLDSSGDGSITISHMYHDYDLEACFALAYSLTVTAGTGGTTNPAPGTYYYASGSPVTVTAIPDAGYEFDHWVRNGVTYTSNPISFTISANTNLVAYFEGIAVPTITVTQPNGGETYAPGASMHITWTWQGDIPYIKLELYKGASLQTTIDSSEGNYGSYTWTIPTSQPIGADYRIKVSSTSGSPYDYSDSYFTIADIPAMTITVTAPNGGETWYMGLYYHITYDVEDEPYGCDFDISLYRGTTYVTHIGTQTVMYGDKLWLIPTNLVAAGDYRVRIICVEMGVDDYSDAYFSILPAPTITVLVPNGGEVWGLGTYHSILWTSTGSAGSYVKIELYKSFTMVLPIATSTPNDGSFGWTVSSTLKKGEDYRVRISSTAITQIYDYSNAYFTIKKLGGGGGGGGPPDGPKAIEVLSVSSEPSITVTSPNGGESWQPGTAQTIAWTYANDPGNYVKIELYRDSVLAMTIAQSTACDGSYMWLIPADILAASDYLVRISSTTTAASDFSDTFFTIGLQQVALTVTCSEGTYWTMPSVGVHYFEVGTSVYCAAVADTGYKFKYWLVDGTTRIKEPSFYIMMDTSHTVYAYCIDAGGGGGGPPNGPKAEAEAFLSVFESSSEHGPKAAFADPPNLPNMTLHDSLMACRQVVPAER